VNIFAQTIDGIQEVLATCPCCGKIFRLVEGKFIFPQKQPRDCEYLDLIALEERVSETDERLTSAEDRFEEKLEAQRQELVEKGRRLAKKRLKKIDPVFSAKDIDPQEVKVIFNPVEYLIFHGLKSEKGVQLIEFVSRSPESRSEEATVESIERTIRNRDVEFETLHLRDDASFEIRREAIGG